MRSMRGIPLPRPSGMTLPAKPAFQIKENGQLVCRVQKNGEAIQTSPFCSSFFSQYRPHQSDITSTGSVQSSKNAARYNGDTRS